jgi:hypothetical protein
MRYLIAAHVTSVLFGRAKTALQNQRFANSGDVIEGLTDLSDNVTFDELRRVFQSWIRRLDRIIRNSGE